MATREQIIYVNSATGEDMDSDRVVTASLTLDGTEWELTLDQEQLDGVREFVAVLTAHEQPVRQARVRKIGSAKSAASSEGARAWLRQQGHPIGDRGRLPANLVAQWEQAGRPAAS